MMSPRLHRWSFWSLLAVVAGAAVIVAAPSGAQAPTRPGEMTQARVWVENRGRAETIPVAIQNDAVPVRVDPANPLISARARQSWEYRSVALPADGDPARALERAGADGWEAVAVLPSAAGGATALLKRPR